MIGMGGFVMLMAIALGTISSHAAPVIPFFVVGLAVVVWAVLRVGLYRDGDGSSGWFTQVPAWSLRPYCPGLRPGLADEVELTGRIVAGTHGLLWTPSDGARRLGASPVDWDRTAGAWTTARNLGGLPSTYVRVTDGHGVTSDLWVRAGNDAVQQRLRSSLGEVEG